MEHVNTDANFENLGMAVAAQAGKDYLYARMRLDLIKKEIKELRQFFKSDQCKNLTDANGKEVLRELDRFYEACRDADDFKPIKDLTKNVKESET